MTQPNGASEKPAEKTSAQTSDEELDVPRLNDLMEQVFPGAAIGQRLIVTDEPEVVAARQADVALRQADSALRIAQEQREDIIAAGPDADPEALNRASDNVIERAAEHAAVLALQPYISLAPQSADQTPGPGEA